MLPLLQRAFADAIRPREFSLRHFHPLDVFALLLVLVEVAFLVVHRLLEKLFGRGIRVGLALERRRVVIPGAPVFHGHGLDQNGLRFDNLLDGARWNYLHVALQEQNPLGQQLDVPHFLDGRLLEQHRQRPEALIRQAKVKIVDGTK
ncbi:MAG: hypothetical protein WBL65_05555 [Bryobacteraceae bacterium]